MDNKKLGIILIITCLAFGFLVYTFNNALDAQDDAGCSCGAVEDGGFCPHEEQTNWPTYLGIILISGIAALGLYLIFFDKSQKAIISTLERHKRVQTQDERFGILLKGLNKDEQKIILAVREQDGITQQTLRLRTDLHKSKLSIILDGLEKKGLVARKEKGKTKQIFLKVGL